jgi:Cu2+-exporting ATPase
MPEECFHCGLEINPGINFHFQVLGKQQSFCCPGCCAVAKAIVDNGLVDYYTYRSEFAERATSNEEAIFNSLSVFDDEDILQEFVESNGDIKEVQLTVSGINCAACGWLIEKQLSKIPGIVKIGVNVSARRASVSWDNKQLKLSKILSLIDSIGYSAKPFQQAQHETSFKAENQAFLKRLGLAGLMTMQVMMLNIGVFFDLFGHIDAQTKQYFNWISLLLTTPVMIYSASEFYSSAFRALKAKVVNMDVPISLALILTYISGLFATAQNSGQTYFESLCMFVFLLLISRYLEHSARYKASQISANMLDYIPTTANLIEGQQIFPILAKSLLIGQNVLVKSGEMVPVDGEITEGEGQLDEAMLTGEFNLVSRVKGETVYAGTVNQLGTLTIRVNKLLKHSMVNQIAELQNKALFNKPRIASIADQFSQYFVVAVLLISLITYFVWLQLDSSRALWVTISVLIATCPCALGLATPSALSSAVAHLNSKGVLVKRADVLEQINKVDWVAFDKTGTLTEGKFSIEKCVLVESLDKNRCLTLAASLEQFSSHPIAKAFVDITPTLNVSNFTSTIAKGISGTIEGKEYSLGSKEFVEHEVPTELKNCNIFLVSEETVLCGFELTDKVRDHSKDMLNRLKPRQLILLSGDSARIVENMANTLGITNWYSEQTPQNKLTLIQQAQENKHTVLMIGDGINDGPVLAQADVSVTLGAGSDLAKSSADVIILDNSLHKLELIFNIASRCRSKIIQNIAWAIGYNLLVLPLAVMGLLAPWMAVVGMSLSSLIVIVNSIRLLK